MGTSITKKVSCGAPLQVKTTERDSFTKLGSTGLIGPQNNKSQVAHLLAEARCVQ